MATLAPSQEAAGGGRARPADGGAVMGLSTRVGAVVRLTFGGLLAAAVTCAALALAPSAEAADVGTPAVTVSPTAVNLLPGETTQVSVVVSAPDDKEVGRGVLTLPTQDGASLSFLDGGTEHDVPRLGVGQQY